MFIINFLIEDIKDYINILKHKENIKFEEFLKDLEVLLNKFKNNKLDADKFIDFA